ncbi:hypothetical protein XENOCAPTIV_023729 [Xenoophorus captivus]|uniref:Uncharacterized protein n=1 Tax=Xenoophorus captivus TaxID=1517983 RepID=A0ABV0S4U2_9TELE
MIPEACALRPSSLADRVTFSPVETAGMVQSCISAAQCAAHPLVIGGGGTCMQSRGGCTQEQGGVRAGRVLRIKGELHLLQTASCKNYSGPYMLCLMHSSRITEE